MFNKSDVSHGLKNAQDPDDMTMGKFGESVRWSLNGEKVIYGVASHLRFYLRCDHTRFKYTKLPVQRVILLSCHTQV